MKRQLGWMVVGIVAAAGLSGHAQGNERFVSGVLQPEQEVPAVSSGGHGTFVAEIDDAGQAVDYRLTFGDLGGTVTQSHIHFAQPNVAGGIVVWLCGTAALPGPAGTPACPLGGGTVTGTITPASVLTVGTGTQGISAGEFDEFIAAVRKGLAYANVHSTLTPSGEIRGQLKPGQLR